MANDLYSNDALEVMTTRQSNITEAASKNQ